MFHFERCCEPDSALCDGKPITSVLLCVLDYHVVHVCQHSRPRLVYFQFSVGSLLMSALLPFQCHPYSLTAYTSIVRNFSIIFVPAYSGTGQLVWILADQQTILLSPSTKAFILSNLSSMETSMYLLYASLAQFPSLFIISPLILH